MKNVLLFVFVAFFSLNAFSQVIFEENFDSFTAGNKLVQTVNNPDLWDTWSSAPGGSEDAAISDKFSHSPNHSLFLANNNDIVLLMNDLTTGRYKLTFQILIETGKIGYFNMLHDFAGSNSQWAFQAYFNAGGNGAVDAGKSDAAAFIYSYDSWMLAEILVDLDDDFATFYLDSTEVVSWKWSSGTFGSGTLHKLDAVNFYGVTSGGSSGMYIDDVRFSLMTPPEIPQTLTASIQNENEVLLSWLAPSVQPDNYVIFRDNGIVTNTVTDTFFVDNPYPGSATYTVRSHIIGEGYSHSSNEASVLIPGGIDRDFVLFEIGTGTGCVYCPGAAMGAVDMIENGDQVIVVKYHNFNANDPFNSAASAERAGNYYGITGYPTSFADGTLSHEGGNPTASLFEAYHNHYVQRLARKALYSVDVNVFHLEGYQYRAEISVQQHSSYNGEQKTLHTALTESDIDFPWFNQDQVHFACHAMFPDAFGTALDFSGTETQSFNIDFNLEEDHVKDNCEFVVFLQADPSKEVMAATKVDLADIVLNTPKNPSASQLQVYPNPVSQRLFIRMADDTGFRITDLTGKTVLDGILFGGSVDVSGLEKGVYFLFAGEQEARRIIIQ